MSQVIADPPGSPSRPEPELHRTESARPGGAGWWWRDLRPLARRLHFYIGVFVGPFLFVAALSGLIYTITPQLDQIVHRDALFTTTTGPSLDLRAQVQAAAAAVPGGTVTEIRPPSVVDGTTRVSFDAPGVREDFARTAFVDPHTGQVTAVLDTFGEWLPVRAWIDEFHRTLLLGDVGRVYSELAASWLWVLTVTGLALWLVRRRQAARVRRTLLPEVSGPRGNRLRSWHGSVGLWAAIGLLFLSATGLTWSQFAGANVTELRSALDWSTPEIDQTLPAAPGGASIGWTAPGVGQTLPADPSDTAPGGRPSALVVGTTADRVLAAARGAGLSDPVAVTPADPGEAWTVSQVKRSWPEKQDSVAVDPASGQVVDTLRFADWPLAGKLAQWGIDAHMGLLFGWVNQVALAALALAVMVLVVWGYRMWWKRRPTRGGLPGAPGGRRPSAGAVGVVTVVALAVGVFLPVLGVSLVAFLLLDVVRQTLRTPGPPIGHDPGGPEPADASAAASTDR